LAAVHRDQLIGRQSHLLILDQAFNATIEGRTLSIHVHGVSGMGKTAIVHTFLRRLITSGRAVVLPGRCYVRELVPYKALDGIVDSLSKYLMELERSDVEVLLPREIRALAQLFPVLQRVAAIADYPRSSRGAADRLPRRRLAFGALRELLRRISEQRPVVLYIDDLQWADADSAALLEEILRPPDPPPLLLITCFRSEEMTSQTFLRDLVSLTEQEDNTELSVGPLEEDDAMALASSLLGASASVERLAHSVVREAQGNPFLIEQLVGYVKSYDADLAATGLDTRITLADMLDSRIRLCPPGSRALLSTLATAGRPIDAAAAFQAAGSSGDERPLVAALQAAHLIRPSGSAGAIELYHDRIREALAQQIDRRERREIHLRVAQTLVDRGLGDPESLYIHYRNGGDPARAAEQAVLAGQRAWRALAFDRAALFYRRALDLEVLDHAQSLEIRRQLAESHANAGRPAAAAATYLDLAERATGMQAIELRSQAARSYLGSGYLARGLVELERVHEALGLALPRSRWATRWSLVWHHLCWRFARPGFERRPSAELAQRDGISLAQRDGISLAQRDGISLAQRDMSIDSCHAAATSLADIDPIRAGVMRLLGLRMAWAAGEPKRAARALGLEACYLAGAGSAARRQVERLLARMEPLIQEADDPLTTGLGHLYTGRAAFDFGQWRQATERCDEAEVIFTEQCPGAIAEVTLARRSYLAALLQRGELAEVARSLPGLLAEAEERGNVLAAASLRARLGMSWLAADACENYRLELERALDAWRREELHAIPGYGPLLHRLELHAIIAQRLADLYQGDAAAALERWLADLPRVKRSHLWRLQTLRIEASFMEGRCALAVADQDSGAKSQRSRVRRAAARIERERSPFGKPLATLLEAGAHYLEGNREAALAALRRAREGFETADMHLLAAASRRRIGELLAGDAGTEHLMKADAWMRQQQIVRPARMTAMLAPGFSGAPRR
ncbi:MAG: AAA family ATPase, partial [Acidobacteriota bacterium]